MEVIFVLCVLLMSYNLASGQAPGDHDESCRTGRNAANKMFSAETRILIDTYDYRLVFDGAGGGVWLPVSLDADSSSSGCNWDGTTLGGVCTRSMRICSAGQQASGCASVQDNWLFSQYIRYEDAKEVLFDVTYRFTDCRPPSCTRPYVTLYQYNRNSVASNTERTEPTNYRPLINNDEMSSRLERMSTSTDQVTLAMPRPGSSLGFYLGVRDEGTCGEVTRIIAYYTACPERVEGLVTYPETGVPLRSGADTVFDARCAANAHNLTTLQVTAFASSSTCTAVAAGGARCACNAGYVTSADGSSCEACAAGTYRALSDSSCGACPSNTTQESVAAAQCDCISGFFRSPQEGPETGCTEPPNALTNLRVTDITATTITITWNRPTTTGRSDFFYRVFHSDPNQLGRFILSRDNLVDQGSTVSYQVTGLVPFTPYELRVSVHNGVSDLDPDGAGGRVLQIASMTGEARPGAPIVEELCTTVVWQEPAEPNGVITGYQLQFSTNRGDPVNKDGSVRFLITDRAHQADGVTVRVRAMTRAGAGEWSPERLVCPAPCMMNLASHNSSISTATITWQQPPGVSGSISYIVERMVRNSGQSFQTASTFETDNSALSYTLTGLTPFTPYLVRVTASSSSIEHDVCTTIATTAEGVSSPPMDFMTLCTTLTWRPPAQPNGNIASYDVEFSTGSEIQLPAQDLYYVIPAAERAGGVSARMRANTGSGPGEWTLNTANDCSSSVGIQQPVSGLFRECSGVELAIVAVCMFLATLVVLVLVFILILYFCVYKRRHSETDKKSNAHELQGKW